MKKEIIRQISYRFWLVIRWIKEHKKKFGICVGIAVLCIIGVCWLCLRTYHSYEVVESVQRKSDTSANYYFSDDGIICYSKDGISFVDYDGEALWNQVFGMESPKLSTCGDYLAIGDIGANSIYVFNKNGLENKMNLEKPIQDLRISKQGVIAVVLSDGTANQIHMYDKSGNLLASIKATISASGYPLTLALSEDGTRLMVSYICFDSGKIKSQLIFYNFSNKEMSDTPAGTYVYDGLFPRVEFVDENTVIACGEEGFYTYQFKTTALESHFTAYAAEAKSIFMTENRLGVITKNPEASVTEEADKYCVEIFNFSGKKKASFTFNFEYKNVSASDEDIIFSNGQACEIYTYLGHRKFEYTFENTIENVLPDRTSKQYIVLDTQNVQTIRLK